MTYIYGGGTFSFIRNHMALSAPAFGGTARRLYEMIDDEDNVSLRLTKMADNNSELVTNEDVEKDILAILKLPTTKCIIMNASLCDYDGKIGDIESGSHAERLESREGSQEITITPANKVISQIKEIRPDVIVVGFKTTTNAPIETQIKKALRMDVDLVLANDTVNRRNVVVSKGGRYTDCGDNRYWGLNDLLKWLRRIGGINDTGFKG